MPERRLSANAQLANAAFISLILLLTLRQSEIWRPMIKQIAKHSANTIMSDIVSLTDKIPDNTNARLTTNITAIPATPIKHMLSALFL